MMPELGKYAGPVLIAYGATLMLLIGLVIGSIRGNARARRALRDAETQRKGRG